MSGYAQVTIFSENLGNPSTTTPIESYSGYQNIGVLVFSGTGDIRNTTISSGYPNASGAGNVFLTGSGSSTFIISGINTSAYQSGTLNLTFGAYKSTTASNMSELTLAYSIDGTNYTSIMLPEQPTGSGTSVWRSITLTSIDIPNAPNVWLKWTNTGTTVGFRLDDISLAGTPIPEPSTYGAITGALALVGTLLYRRRSRRSGSPE
jgi:hypothetical protein